MTSRPLTPGEREMAASIFGGAIDYDVVRIHRRKWFFLHPKRAVMAPDGHIWVHPKGDQWAITARFGCRKNHLRRWMRTTS